MTAISERIKELETELVFLQKSHDSMVAEYNQMVAGYQNRIQNNQNRFQQIAGALQELRQLNNGSEEHERLSVTNSSS